MDPAMASEEASLLTVPAEALQMILEFLPPADAYFARFLCRHVREPAARRVETAVKRMVIEDRDPYAFIALKSEIEKAAPKRVGRADALSFASIGTLLRRAQLDPASSVCFAILSNLTLSDEENTQKERGQLLRALGATKADVKLVLELLFQSRDVDDRDLHSCLLKSTGLPFDQAVDVVKSLRGRSFQERWHLIMELM